MKRPSVQVLQFKTILVSKTSDHITCSLIGCIVVLHDAVFDIKQNKRRILPVFHNNHTANTPERL